ncbi:MAG: PIN domain-containing protein [Dehalococcoidia bacterium]|nr:PIN domain-containing protein [Dehalococcoidia bacterium]
MTYLCDVNIWLALALSGHIHHSACRRWLATVDERSSVMFCRATQQSLLRLLTSTTVLSGYGRLPLTNDEAWDAYQAFLGDERISLRIDEPEDLEDTWRDYARRGSASPKAWMDAYLAAFARGAGYQFVTSDTAFQQYSGSTSSSSVNAPCSRHAPAGRR